MIKQESDRTVSFIVRATLKDVDIVTEEDYTNLIDEKQRKEKCIENNKNVNKFVSQKDRTIVQKKRMAKSQNKFQLKNILHYFQNRDLNILDMLFHHQVIVVILRQLAVIALLKTQAVKMESLL